MRSAVLIASAGLLAFAAWRLTQTQAEEAEPEGEADPAEGGGLLADADSILTTAAQEPAELLDRLTGGILKVSAMARVPRAVLSESNVQAMLRVIRAGEGTAGPNGYRTLFGGGLFDGYADHPRVTIKRSGYTSTAAGAYQFLASTWDETARVMRLADFSPASQDFAAVGRIAARGALDDVRAGRFDAAIRKIAREWASLPGSPYGQPTIPLERARDLYASAGGTLSTLA